MRSSVVYHAVDSHTEGMPTRVITGGVGVLPGRRCSSGGNGSSPSVTTCAPCSCVSLAGTPRCRVRSCSRRPALTRTSASSTSRCPVACRCVGTARSASRPSWSRPAWSRSPSRDGHPPRRAGRARHHSRQGQDGKAESVTPENVASYSHALDQAVEVAGFGEVRYDIAYGGNFYAFVHLEDLGIEFDRRNGQQMLEAGLAIMDAINEQNPVAHPENPEINVCHHVYPRPGLDRSAQSARHGHPPRVVRPVAVRHRQ